MAADVVGDGEGAEPLTVGDGEAVRDGPPPEGVGDAVRLGAAGGRLARPLAGGEDLSAAGDVLRADVPGSGTVTVEVGLATR